MLFEVWGLVEFGIESWWKSLGWPRTCNAPASACQWWGDSNTSSGDILKYWSATWDMILPAAYPCNFIQYFKSWVSSSKHNTPTCLLLLWRYLLQQIFGNYVEIVMWVLSNFDEYIIEFESGLQNTWGHVSLHRTISHITQSFGHSLNTMLLQYLEAVGSIWGMSGHRRSNLNLFSLIFLPVSWANVLASAL